MRSIDELGVGELIEHDYNWIRALVGCQAEPTATDLSGHSGWPLYLERYVTSLSGLSARREGGVVSCNYGGFVSGMCVTPGCVDR